MMVDRPSHTNLNGGLFASCNVLIRLNELVHAINHGLHKLNLRLAQALLVGDIVHASRGLTVLTVDATGLQTQLAAHALKVGVLTHVCQLHVHTGAHSGAAIGGAAVDVAKVVVVLEGVASLLDSPLDGINA